MAIIRAGDWVQVTTARLNSNKTKLKGEVYQVDHIDFATGELIVDTGDIMGRISLLNNEVQLAIAPALKVPAHKNPPITPENIRAKIKSLVDRYQIMGGKLDTVFLEQILGRDVLEQILLKLYSQAKTNICSGGDEGNICSGGGGESGANINKSLPKKSGGKPPGKRNIKPQSGWLDKYESSSGVTWYFCRDEYRRKIKKSKIPNGKKAVVEMMIQLGYPASQIEEELLDNSVIF